MGQKLLVESASTLTKKGNRWKAVLAVPGVGSSGTYSEAMLREFGPKALAPGAKAFINHDPKRDPRDMFGTYPEGAVYEDGVGLVGELEVFPHYKELIETIGTHAALSIYMLGETDDDGNVTALIPDRQNGVDLVSYGGLEGSGIVEKLYESALAHSTKPPTASVGSTGKEGNMDEVLLELRALRAEFTTFVTESKAAALANVKAEASADAIEKDKTEAVESAIKSYDQKIAAIDAAELLPSQVESLRAVAVAGGDVAPLIESAKKVVAEAKGLRESSGYVTEGANGDDYSVARWKVSE